MRQPLGPLGSFYSRQMRKLQLILQKGSARRPLLDSRGFATNQVGKPLNYKFWPFLQKIIIITPGTTSQFEF